MTEEKGWIDGAEILKSPNFDERKDDVSLIVIHAISLPPAKYGSNHIDRFFLNELDPTEDPYFKEISDLKVSSHFLIAETRTYSKSTLKVLRLVPRLVHPVLRVVLFPCI